MPEVRIEKEIKGLCLEEVFYYEEDIVQSVIYTLWIHESCLGFDSQVGSAYLRTQVNELQEAHKEWLEGLGQGSWEKVRKEMRLDALKHILEF
jgi:hypothetical protein